MAHSRPRLRVALLGRRCDFTTEVLRQALRADIEIAALVIAGDVPATNADTAPRIPVTREDTPIDLAAAYGVEVRYLRDAPDASVLAAYRPDLIAVACFPFILDPECLALPRFGAVNLHPSLLPAYRGPTPLFWQFRAGERRTGITLHRMDSGIDTGDIVAQESLELPPGITVTEINAKLSNLGGEMLVSALRRIASGEALPRKPQGKTGGSYCSYPTREDFRITTEWPAERAFRFMRGTREWGIPYQIEIEGQVFTINSAIDFSATAQLSKPYDRIGNELRIQLSPGVLRTDIRY